MIVVTGASRKLGGYVIRSLLEKVPAGQIIAAARNTEKASSLAELGV
jgi:NAD(P)H dehydrogenase (quinone)